MALLKWMAIVSVLNLFLIGAFSVSTGTAALATTSTPSQLQPTFYPTRIAQLPTDLPPAQGDRSMCMSCHGHHGQGVPIADILLAAATGQLVESEEVSVSDQDEVRLFPPVIGK